MKTDRLYAITVYLLNHGMASAASLAEKFEVSVRTIQRDMDSLCQAGIPIAAKPGASGGYFLTDTFRLDGHTATQEDYSYIRTALKGLSSAVHNPKIDAVLEKITAVSKNKEEDILLDFSVLREGDGALMQTLQTAIREKRPVCFTYTNADNVTRLHTVEPVAVVYRWYAWYLLAYSTVKKDYRIYKLVRMRNAEVRDGLLTREHDCAQAILDEVDKKTPPACTTVTVRCKPEAIAKAVEYLNGEVIREYEDGACDMTLYVMEKEHLWFGTLLALGDAIEVLKPVRIRNRVRTAAEKIISLYDKL